jgi:hypothetical protein
MAARAGKRWWWLVTLVVLALLVTGGIVGFQVAVGHLQGRVVEALGPTSEIESIRVGWTSLDVERMRIEGPSGWPAADALRAERIAIVPSLRSLLSRDIRVHSITVAGPYLSVMRTKEGTLQVLPSLLTGTAGRGEPAGSSVPPASSRTLIIGNVVLRDGVVEFFDATVARPPLKIRLEQVQATVRAVVIPALTGKTRLELVGVLKGAHQDGTVSISGWVDIATRDSSLHTTLRSVDMVALQPYLIKSHETGVRKGTLDLDLQSDVSKGRLKAPGTLTISGLELTPGKNVLDTFMGVPRGAAVSSLKNKDDTITVRFALDGDIDDPHFSLNEALGTRVASGMAETLGVSLGGVAKGVGGLGQQGVEAVGEAAKGAVEQFFGGRKKR